ncbi:MAG: DsbA family protein [Pseudomonadota bacterium]
MQEQSSDKSKTSGRRGVLVLGAAFLAVVGANELFNRPAPPDFEDVPGLPEFRMLRFGGVSGQVFDPFIGIDTLRAAVPRIPDAQVCGTLFTHSGHGVPVASFSDYFCPYCRVLTRELTTRAEAGDISVTWHELPLLGETSVMAARAALAADMQGAYLEIHNRLMRSRVVATDAYLENLAEGAGLNAARFVRDANSELVQNRIQTAQGLAERFGFYGTPALVVGRTAVLGSIPVDKLDRLIADERILAQAATPACG